MRRDITRYNKANMEANEPLLELLDQVAAKKGATKAQIALAWMLDRHANPWSTQTRQVARKPGGRGSEVERQRA